MLNDNEKFIIKLKLDDLDYVKEYLLKSNNLSAVHITSIYSCFVHGKETVLKYILNNNDFEVDYTNDIHTGFKVYINNIIHTYNYSRLIFLFNLFKRDIHIIKTIIQIISKSNRIYTDILLQKVMENWNV